MKDVAFFLIIIAVGSVIYKAYLDDKIENPGSKRTIISIMAFRAYGFMTFIPKSIITKNEKEKKLRARANISILIFYLCFLAVLVLSAIHSKK